MRNLRNTHRTVVQFSDPGLPLSATAWDSSSNALICAFGPTKADAVIELKRLKSNDGSLAGNLQSISSWDSPCPNPDLECDEIVSLHYFADTATACLVLAGGDVVAVREQPLPGEDSIEIVGSVDAGIQAAEWSPDEELLAIVTRADTLIYMTREFHAPTNITLTPDDVKVSNHVSVGWGKAETQFKGKRAKVLRDPTVPEHVDEGVLSSFDDGKASVSWRGDGAYVAINTVEAEKRRMIRVYSREGILDSVSEPVDGLEGALSWRPAGNLIAGIQRLSDRIDVVFFERNGLRHGQFSLRLSPEEANILGRDISLSWNGDSSVLAVSLQDRVQFWTMGNYHYYLKQEIKAASNDAGSDAMKVRWHSEAPLQVTLSKDTSVQILEFIWNVSSGPTTPPYDTGSVAVIDGATLKLTPLRLANVPPPVSLHEVVVETNIKDVAFSSTGKKLAVLCDEGLYVYSYLEKTKPPAAPKLLSKHQLDLGNALARQIVFHKDEAVLIADRPGTEENCCYRVAIDDGSPETVPLPTGRIKNIASTLEHERVFVQSNNSTIYEITAELDSSNAAGTTGVVTKFPSEVTRFEVACLRNQVIAFGLTPRGTLYANDKALLKNCTSFLVTSTHLVVTTSQHLLKFIALATDGAFDIPPDEPEIDERCRSIERGGRLVTIMPTTYSVVLQMPRGNLETIYPRAPVLDGIRRSINEKDYRTAFLACRNHRVDMNILHDHAPTQFLESVSLFISQLKDPGHLDLFLSGLRDEDVTETMYRKLTKSDNQSNGISPSAAADSPSSPTVEGKINRICDAILNELLRHPEGKTQNIITANVCKNPPDLEAGLRVVGELQASKDEGAERAAEHICFLADVNQLYDHALGLYNLELALLIAQQSQKDPREYLPYLQSLQELSPIRRAFAIDDKLGRRAKALKHLHEMEVFDEFDSYTQKHDLYEDALQLVKYQPDRLKNTMRLYADWLLSKDKFKEAGIAYEYLQDYPSATTAYRSAHLWRESLTCALLVPYTPASLTSLAETLADNLVELKDYASAACIHRDFLDDIPGAAKLFCRAYQFGTASQLLALKGHQDLFTEIIDASLAEASGTMTELVAECKNQLNAQVPRLRELREKKKLDPLAFYAGDVSAMMDAGLGGDIPDNISIAPTDASTTGTFMTRYTQRTGTINTTTSRKTSKNRRREERKRARGKKGSVYEEEYLVNSIGRLVERISDVSGDVESLVMGLVRRGMRERAEAVERAFIEIRAMIDGCLNEVFEVEEKKAVVEGEDGELGERPMGGEGVLWDSIQEGKRKREAPVLKKFERLALM